MASPPSEASDRTYQLVVIVYSPLDIRVNEAEEIFKSIKCSLVIIVCGLVFPHGIAKQRKQVVAHRSEMSVHSWKQPADLCVHHFIRANLQTNWASLIYIV